MNPLGSVEHTLGTSNLLYQLYIYIYIVLGELNLKLLHNMLFSPFYNDEGNS